jgi:hypothetical protein
MTTLAEITARAQNAIGDAAGATWSDAKVEEWIIEAIRDYSVHFPRTVQDTLVKSVTPTYVYSLPADFLGMVCVEFPEGEDPPRYLKRRSYLDPGFWDSDEYYDVEPTRDAAEPAKLHMSALPDTEEDIAITYTTYHAVLIPEDDDDTDITVPEHHEHLLILFVVWKAAAERVLTDQADPNSFPALLASMRLVTSNARDAYNDALRQAEKQEAPGGWTGPWRSDEHDRIY